MMIIDFQGLKMEANEFVIKEFAAFNGEKTAHYVFKSPFKFSLLSYDLQRQAIWLSKNHHCLNWNVGFTPIHNFKSIFETVTLNEDNVYIKGVEKCNYIRKFTTKNIIQLPEQPSLISDTPLCFYHSKSSCICALTNVYYLYNLFKMIE